MQQQVPKDGSQRPQGYAFRIEDGELAIAKTGKAPLDERRNQIRRSIYSAALEHFIPEAVVRRATSTIEFIPGHASDKWIDRLYKLRNQTPAFIEELYHIAENVPQPTGQVRRFEWGVSEMRIDKDALEEGLFVLTNCRGILPNGDEFDLPAAEALPEPRLVDGAFSIRQMSYSVYIAASAVSRKQPRFQILMEGEDFEDCSVIRIAQLIRDARHGHAILDPENVPPCIDIGSSDYLMRIGRQVVEVLSLRAGSLSVSRRQRSMRLAEFSGSDTSSFLLLQIVNTFLPELTHVLITRGHPEQLFVTMLRFAGALSTFSLDLSARRLPVCDHENLGSCVAALETEIRVLLETVVPSRYISLPLRAIERHKWTCEI